jgi:hypothetical protein
MRAVALTCALLLQASLAVAAPPTPTPRVDPVERVALATPTAALREPTASRALPAAAAIVPGVIVHGAGHYALGQAATGRHLLLMEGLGLGLFLGGGLTIVFTGASRYFTAPAASATMLGFGLFSTSYLADIYGSLATDGGAVRYPPPASWETELGYRRLQDPEFAYRDFVFQRVSRQLGPLRLSPSGFFSLRGDTARYRVEAQYRLAGQLDQAAAGDLSFVDLTLGFVHQLHGPEHFSRSSGELSCDARYDLRRLGASLRGSFIELGAGYALARVDYNLTGLKVPSDLEHVLLARIGFGVLLRGESAPGSEALLYYDHRHDDYVAGLKLRGIGSGVLGHFGLSARWFFNRSLGLALDAQAGSAYLGGASLLFRSAPPSTRPRAPAKGQAE